MILDAKVYSKLKPILDTYGSLRADVSFVALGKGRLPSLLPRTAAFQYVLVATAAWKNQIYDLIYNISVLKKVGKEFSKQICLICALRKTR